MARAAMRMLQMSPGLRDKWSLAPIQALLLHIDADVRWAGVECMAILTNMVRAPLFFTGIALNMLPVNMFLSCW